MSLDEQRAERYKAALAAAVKAKNPWMAASIRAAMRGEEFDPFEGMSLHPEVDHLWNFPSQSAEVDDAAGS